MFTSKYLHGLILKQLAFNFLQIYHICKSLVLSNSFHIKVHWGISYHPLKNRTSHKLTFQCKGPQNTMHLALPIDPSPSRQFSLQQQGSSSLFVFLKLERVKTK